MNPKRLTGFIKQKLLGIHKNSRVYTTVVIPDYSKHCVLEIERRETEEAYRIIQANPPFLRCLVSKEYYNQNAYIQRLRDLDYQIDQHIMKPNEGSKTAFMSLESLESIAKLKGELE